MTPLPDGGRRIELPGGGLGISSYVRIVVGDRFALAILSNLTGARVGGALADEIESAFRGRR